MKDGEDSLDGIQILGELIGAYGLSIQENLKDKHVRPYCIVKLRNETIHYSSPCADTGINPIWTFSTSSLFMINLSLKTILQDKLQISVWSRRNSSSIRGKLRGSVLVDMDTFFLGKVELEGKSLLRKCNEERLEFPLLDRHNAEIHSDSTLSLRFRLATKRDIRLLDLLREKGLSPPRALSDSSFRKSSFNNENAVKAFILSEGSSLPIAPMVTETPETKLAGDFIVDALAFAFTPSTRCDRETGLRKIRVKPFPDPTRIGETEFMSPLQISKETMEPSQRWVEAGSGSLGTLHLEILSCHGLPNVDVGEAVGNLSDCFVCAVFEDVMVQTPVIDDELSPHWLPWTQRAFRVGIVHPASTLFLGVLDYDLGPGSHEPIGRVAVSLSNLQSSMLYTLNYNLHPTSDLTERTVNGSIKIRLRIEYNDEKAAVLAALQPRPAFHVNTWTYKTFKAVRYTCFGEYDVEEKFSWPVTRSYIGEVLEYWRALKFYFGQSLWSLIFWRGQVTVGSKKLPVHSAVLFVSCATLVEKPWLIIPFFSLFIAWFMLATMSLRRQTPSPWSTCNSFLHYARMLLNWSERRERIRPSEFLSKTQAFEEELRKWKEKYQNDLDKQWAQEEKLMTIGNENIQTEVAGQVVPLDLLDRLGRYQGVLGRLCIKIRKIKSIILWEESATSFWIAFIFLASGLVTLLLPWRFLLYHVCRITCWVFLGPHMKLVDAYVNAPAYDDTKASKEFRKQSRLARMRREEAMKLKDLKCLAFGEYVTLIPAFNLPRHYDRPLHDSFATHVPPCTVREDRTTPCTSRVPGQQFYGSMAPHTKAGLSSLEGDSKISKARLTALEEQVARLQSIANHLSSQAASSKYMDSDLPDDLGYEITLCDDEDTTIQAPIQGVPKLFPEDYGLSLAVSETGFDTTDRVTETEGRSWDMHNDHPSPNGPRTQFAREGPQSVDVFYMPPLQTHLTLDDGKGQDLQCYEFMTPLQKHDSADDDEGEDAQCYMTPVQTHPPANDDKQTDPPSSTPLLQLALTAYTHDKVAEEQGRGGQSFFSGHQNSRHEEKKTEYLLSISSSKFPELNLHDFVSSVQSKRPVDKAAMVQDDRQHRPQILGPNRRQSTEESSDHTTSRSGKDAVDEIVGPSRRNSTDEASGTCYSNEDTVVDEIVGQNQRNTTDEASDDMTSCYGKQDAVIDRRGGPKQRNTTDERFGCYGKEDAVIDKRVGPNQRNTTDEGSDDWYSRSGKVAAIEPPPHKKSTASAKAKVEKYAAHASADEMFQLYLTCGATEEIKDMLAVRRTWSSSSLRTKKQWIKDSPTDSVLLQAEDTPRPLGSAENAQRPLGSYPPVEEGLEVVVFGRLSTVGDEADDNDPGDAADVAGDDHSFGDCEPISGLPVPYESSSHVQVTMYRPY